LSFNALATVNTLEIRSASLMAAGLIVLKKWYRSS